MTSRWLEDLDSNLRAHGHDVHRAFARNPALSKDLQRLLLSRWTGAPLAARIERRVEQLAPDLIVCVGAFEPEAELIFEYLRSRNVRSPMIAWIGDGFTERYRKCAGYFDLVAYTDTGFLEMHDRLAFSSDRIFLPLAADATANSRMYADVERSGKLCFVAAPTDNRRAFLAGLEESVDVYGPGWGSLSHIQQHGVNEGVVGEKELASIYQRYAGSLNIKNGKNVIHGLNQRHFAPYIFGAAVVSDRVQDLETCFEPGGEIATYRDSEELAEIIRRSRKDVSWLRGVGVKGRRRIVAEHQYVHRIDTLASHLIG